MLSRFSLSTKRRDEEGKTKDVKWEEKVREKKIETINTINIYEIHV